MSWKDDLWDKYDSLVGYTEGGINTIRKFELFFGDRRQIERDYAARLRSLVIGYEIPGNQCRFHAQCEAFNVVLAETKLISERHEVIARDLYTKVIGELTSTASQLNARHKELTTSKNITTAELKQAFTMLEQKEKIYLKLFRKAEQCLHEYQKAEAKNTVTSEYLLKLRVRLDASEEKWEDAKMAYICQLRKTNEMQRAYYHEHLPNMIDGLQKINEDRINQINASIGASSEVQCEAMPEIRGRLENIVTAAERVSPSHDIGLVHEKYRSNRAPPGDVPYRSLNLGASVVEQPGEEVKLGSLARLRRSLPLRRVLQFGGRKMKHGASLEAVLLDAPEKLAMDDPSFDFALCHGRPGTAATIDEQETNQGAAAAKAIVKSKKTLGFRGRSLFASFRH